MQRVIKSLTGYHKETDRKEATHVILTVSEYNSLIEKIDELQMRCDKILEDAEHERRNILKNSKNYKIEVDKDADERINSVLNDFNHAKSEIIRLNDLNANLKRICKERANKNRSLNDKKKHFGYLYIGGKQITFRCKTRKEILDLEAWSIKIQTPYDYTLRWNHISKEIEKDLSLFTQNMGLEKDYSHELLEMSKNDIDELWSSDEKNFYFKIIPIANNSTGLWEIELYTRYDIEVPEIMLN